MNNEQIILEQRLTLMDEGKIRSTGNLMDYLLPNGRWIKVPEPVPIHTQQKWNALGYSLNEFEVPIATFKIWKPYRSSKGKGIVFKTADFYSQDQVHKD